MKPNFALTLSFDGIGLLHRAAAGWHLVGEVALDSADLSGELAALRDKALRLDPSGLACKLVIPNDQIRYTAFAAGDLEGDALAAAAQAALEGQTPYELAELALDWSVSEGRVLVAAVALETLEEAESFAAEHAFNPVSFVTIPEEGAFSGEPFFGPGRRAEAGGTAPERDDAPVRIVGAARMPDVKAPVASALPDAPAEAAGTAADKSESPASGQPPDAEETAEDGAASPAATFLNIRASRSEVPSSAPKPVAAARLSFGSETTSEAADGPPAPTISEETAARLGGTLTSGPEAPAPAAAQSAAFASRRTARNSRRSGTDRPAAAFGEDAPARRRTPRYLGLTLTIILLLLLAGVAAWASIFFEDGLARLFRDDAETAAAEDPAAAALPEAPAGTAPQAPDAPVDPEETADVVIASLSPEDSGTDADSRDRPARSPPEPAELTPDEALARYAATGIWQLAPLPPRVPQPGSLDAFYQTSIDPAVAIHDAVALPDPRGALTDARPAAPPPPPPPDTRYDFDDRGLVVAAEEGAMTPQGVTVYAGRPAVVPPPTPSRPEAGIVAYPDIETLRMGAIRPRMRPDDLSELNERRTLNGLTRTELAALPPRLRPQSAQEAAEAAGNAEDRKDATAATEQAVAVSLTPEPRPGDFARTVARARTRQPGAGTQAAASQTVTPSIPSRTSVTKQATERNALNLRRVNLIGVYGTPEDRRALVRLGNGRYRKVKVGDRLDGGRVAAIGDSELRYTKRGRSVVLKMPKG